MLFMFARVSLPFYQLHLRKFVFFLNFPILITCICFFFELKSFVFWHKKNNKKHNLIREKRVRRAECTVIL